MRTENIKPQSENREGARNVKKNTKSDNQKDVLGELGDLAVHLFFTFRVNLAIACTFAATLATLLAIVPLYAQTPDRSTPPKLGPPPSLRLPDIHHLKLANGLPVVLMEKPQVPLVQINLVVRAGGAMETADKAGLATLTADMLDKGAGRRDALQLADAIDFLGAIYSAQAGLHTTAISINTPVARLDSALALLADIVMRPTFPDSELARLRKQRLTTLLQWHDDPRSVASVMFNRTLYGDKHPYGRPSLGSETSLRQMTTDELKKFHGTYYYPSNATLIVVGAVTAPMAQAKLETAFSAWPAGIVHETKWPAIKQIEKRHTFLVDKPGAAQSEIRIGRIGVPRLTEDYYAISVMNTILGGSFTSRLNQNLREQHGYSYGAGSSFNFRPLPGPFLAAAAVQTAVTDKALVEFMKELQRILEPVTDDELTRAKNYLALGFPGDFQSVGQIAGKLEELVVYDLPDDYFNNYIGRILAVTKEQVQQVAKKYLDPEKVAVIVVGDRKVIEKGVRELNLGPLQLMTIEQVLGKAPKVEGAD